MIDRIIYTFRCTRPGCPKKKVSVMVTRRPTAENVIERPGNVSCVECGADLYLDDIEERKTT